MDSIYVSFNLKPFSSCSDSNDVFENNFQTVFKPLIQFLYSHPSFSFSFAFSGRQIQFFKKRKNEFIAILRELVERNQVEIFGGGYYEPLLPLLYPVDRNGQIDLLSAEIRQTFGKRPRGIVFFEDCWDSALVNNIHTCGIEYAILDSVLLQENKRKFLPIIMSDLGKSVDIYLYHKDLVPNKDISPETFIQNIVKAVKKIEKNDNHIQLCPERIINLNLTQEDVVELTQSKWFEKFFALINDGNSNIKLTSNFEYKSKIAKTKIPAYIPVGISESVSVAVNKKNNESKSRSPFTIYDYMHTYPNSQYLYNRIMYISMLVNQYKNDKMRKKAAREKLWEAQAGTAILFTTNTPYENSLHRQKTYKNLMEAEKILRKDGKFKQCVTRFDYDNDGLDEYICRMEHYFSYISLISGAVRELDLIKNTGNYLNNLRRDKDFDGCCDDYDRGLFVDHLFTKEQFNLYIKNERSGDGVFSRIQYSEVKFSQIHHEIQLAAHAVWKPTNQAVYLRKKYEITAVGMTVQYIIKNESDKKLCAKFAVESSIVNPSFNPLDVVYFSDEVVDNEAIVNLDTSENTYQLNSKGKLNDVQIARLTDTANGISFVFEPNEKCGYFFSPITFHRPSFDYKIIEPVSMSFVSTLFWDLNIEPGMETEKYINFTIVPVKKSSK